MDLIRYILDRVALRLPGTLTHDLAREIEREIRQHWGGDRPYVPKTCENYIVERNAAILRDWQNGERMVLMVRRYKLNRSQIWRIVRREKDVASLP